MLTVLLVCNQRADGVPEPIVGHDWCALHGHTERVKTSPHCRPPFCHCENATWASLVSLMSVSLVTFLLCSSCSVEFSIRVCASLDALQKYQGGSCQLSHRWWNTKNWWNIHNTPTSGASHAPQLCRSALIRESELLRRISSSLAAALCYPAPNLSGNQSQSPRCMFTWWFANAVWRFTTGLFVWCLFGGFLYNIPFFV